MKYTTNDLTLLVVSADRLEITRAGLQLITGLKVEIRRSDAVPKMALVILDDLGNEIDYICEGDIVVVRDNVHPCYSIITPELLSFLFHV